MEKLVLTDTPWSIMTWNANEAVAAGAEMKTLDWDRVAWIIRDNHLDEVEAGLAEDWSATSDTIYCGMPCVESHYLYICSIWATPCIYIPSHDIVIPCWKYGNETKQWPQSALNILHGGVYVH